MLIGVSKEVKSHEYRVGLTPGSVREIVHHGHEVVVEAGAGTGIGFEDASYEAVGARILPNKTEVFAAAELIVKVKEPQPQEAAALREGQVLFTYLHLTRCWPRLFSGRVSSRSPMRPSPTRGAGCRSSRR